MLGLALMCVTDCVLVGWGGLGESVLSSAHRVWRWKHLSGSITCIRASFSDQLTTTKCNRKGSFFSSRDVSGVLVSNFIFIDHRLFCSISTELAEGHLISSRTIKVANMSWLERGAILPSIQLAFQRWICYGACVLKHVNGKKREPHAHAERSRPERFREGFLLSSLLLAITK